MSVISSKIDVDTVKARSLDVSYHQQHISMGLNLTPKALCCGHQLKCFPFKYFYLISERIQLFHHFGMPHWL